MHKVTLTCKFIKPYHRRGRRATQQACAGESSVGKALLPIARHVADPLHWLRIFRRSNFPFLVAVKHPAQSYKIEVLLILLGGMNRRNKQTIQIEVRQKRAGKYSLIHRRRPTCALMMTVTPFAPPHKRVELRAGLSASEAIQGRVSGGISPPFRIDACH